MRIAIVGTGIAGNVVANQLAPTHDMSVFEAGSYIGGHTNTVDVSVAGREFAVDTGFIVFNDRTYPEFIALLDRLGVASQPSQMSFSVQDPEAGLEYNGSSLRQLFVQPRNWLRPRFHRMLLEIIRFNREAPSLLMADSPELSLSEYLEAGRYSREFVKHYILPMGAAVWSAPIRAMADMPARFFVRFFANHGMLSVNDRPLWRVIQGGSRRYVEKLVANHRHRIQLECPVEWITRARGKVTLKARGAAPQEFDRVFLACHSDQALALLRDPSPVERQVLGAIRYQSNEAVLHTDTTVLPRHRRAWAAWNYHVSEDPAAPVAVTYNMNILQSLQAPVEFCVTLNRSDAIDPSRIIERIPYSHPVFDSAAVAAQRQHAAVNGVRGTYFCGAYWRYGFHEDGVVSALTALEHFAEREQHAQCHLPRAS